MDWMRRDGVMEGWREEKGEGRERGGREKGGRGERRNIQTRIHVEGASSIFSNVTSNTKCTKKQLVRVWYVRNVRTCTCTH